MGALFGVLTLIAGIWTIVIHQRIYNAAIEFLPPQFQDEMSSRFAFPVWALSHPMPLDLQEDYVRLLKVSTVAVLCGTLALFSTNNILFGCVGAAAFLVSVFKTIKGAKIYEQNRIRARSEESERNA